jgi:hypothetical protein
MRFQLLHIVALVAIAVVTGCQGSGPDNSRPQDKTQGSETDARDITKVTPEQKKEFLELLEQLPRRGEFFTDEGVQKASPFLHVLLALNKEDINENDYFALLALSRGLHDAKKEHREFAVKHFAKIPHPVIKIFWGIVLFRYSSDVSPEITRYLRESLDDRELSEIIRSMAGPEFEAVRKQIIATGEKQK